jgi:hypothetical protein
MTGDDRDPRTLVDAVAGDPLGTTDPKWRDDHADARPAVDETSVEDSSADDDAERTLDADPAWLAELAAEPTAGAADDDAERTIDADADLIEHVRAASRAARSGLAAPPATSDAESDSAPAADPAGEDPAGDDAAGGAPATIIDPAPPPPPAGIDLALPPPPAGVPAAVPPPTDTGPALPPPIADRPAAAAAPAAAAPASPAATSSGGGRWQPPARLRPAELRVAAPLIADRTPKRGHLDRRWALLGVVVAAVVGFLIAIAINGGDDAPDPAPGSTTVPGAPTTVSTP